MSRKTGHSLLTARITSRRKTFSESMILLSLLVDSSSKIWGKIMRHKDVSFSKIHSSWAAHRLPDSFIFSKYGMTSTKKLNHTRMFKIRFWKRWKSTSKFGIPRWSSTCPQVSNTSRRPCDSVSLPHSLSRVNSLQNRSSTCTRRPVSLQFNW
jgi:hypothetical protein